MLIAFFGALFTSWSCCDEDVDVIRIMAIQLLRLPPGTRAVPILQGHRHADLRPPHAEVHDHVFSAFRADRLASAIGLGLGRLF
eukprot:scaffold7362_cov266-Pinguiococcus_pyrenoidosus.AAC.25